MDFVLIFYKKKKLFKKKAYFLGNTEKKNFRPKRKEKNNNKHNYQRLKLSLNTKESIYTMNLKIWDLNSTILIIYYAKKVNILIC